MRSIAVREIFIHELELKHVISALLHISTLFTHLIATLSNSE